MENTYIVMTFCGTDDIKYIVVQDDANTFLLDTFNVNLVEIDDYLDFIEEIDFKQEVIIDESMKKPIEEWIFNNDEFISRETLYNLGKVLGK